MKRQQELVVTPQENLGELRHKRLRKERESHEASQRAQEATEEKHDKEHQRESEGEGKERKSAVTSHGTKSNNKNAPPRDRSSRFLNVPSSSSCGGGGEQAAGAHKYSTRSQDERQRQRVASKLKTANSSHTDHGSGRSHTHTTCSTYREKAPEPTSTSYSSYQFLRNKQTPPWREDDEDGHYRYHLGENLTKRYKILSHLGEGTFGKVLECWDRLRKQYVAIKVIRNVPKYRVAGMLELEVLNTIKKHRKYSKGGSHCVHFKEWFDYRGHICIVFSKLGLTLFDLLRKNSYRPFDLFHVQRFAKQLLETVSFLHGIHLIHTDLKPENILLPSHKYYKVPPNKGSKRGKRIPEKSDISLIDFGSATFEDRHHSKVVSTRHYRAPEVMLGLAWSFPCDIWSVGCIIVELVTGEALFKTHDNLEHLAMMQKVLGNIPSSMVSKMRTQSSSSSSANPNPAREYFEEKDGTLAWPQRCDLNDSVQAVNELRDLWGIIYEKCDISVLPAVENLVDLLKALLRFDPDDRISAKAALEHSFFSIQAGSSFA